jgi:hypothetical protein
MITAAPAAEIISFRIGPSLVDVDVPGAPRFFREPSAGNTDPNGASEVNAIDFRSRSGVQER